MKNYQAGDKGLIKTILLIVVALLILSYFGINLRALVSAPTTQDNFSYVVNTSVNIWDTYLKAPATYLWNLFISLVWNAALHNVTLPPGISTTTPY